MYSTAGESIHDVEIRGCVEVRAANVSFTNVLFSGDCLWAVRIYSGNATITDAEINCFDHAGSSGIVTLGSASVATVVRRVEMHNCENGLSVQGNVAVYDSWIHDLIPFSQGQAHSDGAQFDQGAANIRFQHNTIDSRGDTTSAIIMWDEGDPQNRDVAITGNLLAGGAYTLYCGRSGTAVNVSVDHNRFVPGAFGYANACGDNGELWSANVLDATGAVAGPA